MANIIDLYGPGMSFYLGTARQTPLEPTLKPTLQPTPLEVRPSPAPLHPKTDKTEIHHRHPRPNLQQPKPGNQNPQATHQQHPAQHQLNPAPTPRLHSASRLPPHLASRHTHPAHRYCLRATATVVT